MCSPYVRWLLHIQKRGNQSMCNSSNQALADMLAIVVEFLQAGQG